MGRVLQVDTEAGTRNENAVQGQRETEEVLSRGISRAVIRVSRAALGRRKEGFLGGRLWGQGDPCPHLLGCPR